MPRPERGSACRRSSCRTRALAASAAAGRRRHGQIQIETFRLHEASLPALFEEEKKTSQRHVGSSALNPDSFVITGEQRLKKFVVRAQSSGSEVRGVTILYDQATEGTMAPVAVAVSDTFVGFPDPNAVPPPGRKRGVEYGSAIVVTSARRSRCTGPRSPTNASRSRCRVSVTPIASPKTRRTIWRCSGFTARAISCRRRFGWRDGTARAHAVRHRRSAGAGRRRHGDAAPPRS